MKTKVGNRDFGNSVISGSFSKDEASSTHSTDSGIVLNDSYEMDSQSAIMNEDPLRSSILPPAEDSSDAGDSSDNDDSNWEDYDEDLDDDDICITFQDECDGDIVRTFQNDCTSRIQSLLPASLCTTGRGPYLQTNGYKSVPRINGYLKISISGHIPHGSHHQHQNNQFWVSKLTQGCSKRLKCPPVSKKVHFNDKELVQVHEFDDDEDSKQNRKKYWEIFAIDRARFKERIYRTEQAIGSIISNNQHRDKVYQNMIQFHGNPANEVQKSQIRKKDVDKGFKHYETYDKRSSIRGSKTFHVIEVLLLILLIVIANNNNVIGNCDPLY